MSKGIGNVCPARVRPSTEIVDDSWSKKGYRQVKTMAQDPHEPAELGQHERQYWVECRSVAICKHCGGLFATDDFRAVRTHE